MVARNILTGNADCARSAPVDKSEMLVEMELELKVLEPGARETCKNSENQQKEKTSKKTNTNSIQ